MASQTRTYDQKKLLGQIYTPLHIVEKILEECDFYNQDFDQISILDPACGDGRFLVPIAQYIIDNSSPDQIKLRLERLHGWDIDAEAIEKCRQNLNDLLTDQDIQIDWKLWNLNALEQIDTLEKFDLIVGNPPYIRIQHLPASQRKYIQAVYSFCNSGSTDAYMAFFQLASRLLSDKGVCGFITPNSYFTSETGKPLRSYFAWNQNLRNVTNYASVRVFGTTGTYAAITVFGKQRNDKFRYELSDHDFNYSRRDILFSELTQNEKWRLSITESQTVEGSRLGDLCQISVGVTTLADSFYLFSIKEETEELVRAISKNGKEVWLEKNLLKPVVKASKLKSSSDPITTYILFPYQKNEDDKHKIIAEDELQNKYPQTYAYFLDVKVELDKRDNGAPNAVAWYAFGRAQGLDSSFGKKIIFSPMNRYPNFVLYENPDCTVYSGYFLKYDGDYEALLSQLNSQRMADFVAVAGRDFQGGYKGYNKKVIENFIVTDLK